MKRRISEGVARIRREVVKPASFASTIWLAAQIRMSAFQIVAMPCSAVPSTRMAILPLRKSIGAMRRDFADRKSVVEGKSVSVRVDLGGRRIIKKKNNNYTTIRVITYQT